MKLVFPYSPKDQDIAVLLAEWIRELGGCTAHSVLIVRDHRCDSAKDDAIKAALMAAFDGIEVLTVADDVYNSWPESANLMFKRAAKHIELTKPEPFFWIEPDAIPLKPGWLDAIAAEYAVALAAGKHFVGARVDVAGVPLHMSGVAVYPGVMSRHGGLAYLTHEIAWDVFAAEQIVPQAHFTNRLEHSWKRDSVTKENLRVTFESWDQVEREVSKEAAIYHASKDGSLIARLRERKVNLPVPVLAEKPLLTPRVDEAGNQARESTRAKSSDYIIPAAEADIPRRDSRGGQSFTCDILIKSYPPDYERLSCCLRSIDKFASGFRKIVLVIPKGSGAISESAEPKSLNIARWMSVVEVEERADGYLFQQAVKANAHEYTDADYVLHVDSDLFFNRPFMPETFMRDGKPLWLITPYAELERGVAEAKQRDPAFHDGVMVWKPVTEKFLGEAVEFEFMRRLPLFAPRALHVAAAAFCKARHGVSLTEYILSQTNREFSEFNGLGALAYSRAREDFSWLDTTKEPLPELVAIQKWSREEFTAETKAEFEEILKGENNDINRPLDSASIIDRDSCGPDRNRVRDYTNDPLLLNPRIKQTREGIWVLANDSHISRWIEERGSLQHDYQTLPQVLEEIQPGDHVVDIGSFVGDTAKPFLDRVGPTGHVYCFEPNPDAYECLMRNFNNVENVSIDMNAVADVDAADVYLNAVDPNAGAAYVGTEGSKVRTITLDSLRLARCDFIKVDAEGYEDRVLKAAEQTISRFHPKLLLEINHGALERQGTTAEAIFAWLKSHGYEWKYVLPPEGENAPQTDILCWHVGPPHPLDGQIVDLTPIESVTQPWADVEASQAEINRLVTRLQRFCTVSVRTRQVRDALHSAGVIDLPYRYRRRKGKWKRKRTKA